MKNNLKSPEYFNPEIHAGMVCAEKGGSRTFSVVPKGVDLQDIVNLSRKLLSDKTTEEALEAIEDSTEEALSHVLEERIQISHALENGLFLVSTTILWRSTVK